MIVLLLALAAVLYLVSWSWSQWTEFQRNVAMLSHLPTYKLLIHPHHLFSMLVPRMSYINLGEQYTWRYKMDLYWKDKPAIAAISSAMPMRRSIVISDAQAVKAIANDRISFVKPVSLYAALALFGPNVGVVEGAEWRRHRKIVVGPNFQETTGLTAWTESIRTVNMCIEDWRAKQTSGEVVVQSAVKLTLKIALFVICAAGFSQRPPWRDDAPEALPKDHKMPFRTALHGVLENVFTKFILPNWALRLPIQKWRHTGQAFDEFERYLREMVAHRRATSTNVREGEDGREDLLGSLTHANASTDASEPSKKLALTDQEVMGNIYIFLLAGHDTTAHTLAFTLALLALYPEEQKRLYEHIASVVPADGTMDFELFPRLTRSLAVFMETLRLYPSVVIIPKYSVVDAVVPITGDDGKPATVFLPKGGEVMINTVGLHYSQRYWGPDASAFRPDRFIDAPDGSYSWPREAFLGFSAGPRSCLGQKFAQVEAVAILSALLFKYEVLLKEDVDGTAPKGETLDQKRARITQAKTVITLTPSAVPIIFREREIAH
ncbi:uncharacterized protein L969DRAFT_86923 [Mixia osmundae IAM 14324]|uniref:Cytochrome P450 n=1 Tax=Mixia osmundae (strain CBS 9802 / IAM 14324 / JCM 22182 / KY 12970) TaxID=764103 RepID=G7E931_MIXOS|nr:uncharacterized protein L969DRAFT_86923 [Mixia osmundae IAM 14324]KEI40285.1 hypothetical protein L969DRAFT_86923 [Mixia osmundae IAM 14324]GAA99649.1 hypothetical protein E5Q_06352 [Mixia osmundae IAM 14324]